MGWTGPSSRLWSANTVMLGRGNRWGIPEDWGICMLENSSLRKISSWGFRCVLVKRLYRWINPQNWGFIASPNPQGFCLAKRAGNPVENPWGFDYQTWPSIVFKALNRYGNGLGLKADGLDPVWVGLVVDLWGLEHECTGVHGPALGLKIRTN